MGEIWTLAINEEFYSIQGEGLHTGIPMYFVRLQGCEVGCYFCDTKYTWRRTPKDQLVCESDIVRRVCDSGAKWVCITGGEPYEQDLSELVDLLHSENLRVHIETSGTEWQGLRMDWICLSPKDLFSKKKTLAMFKKICHEIKVVVTKPEDLEYYIKEYYPHTDSVKQMIIQMVDNNQEHLHEYLERIRLLPNTRIMLQTHKIMNLR
jgi:7-carboxy-7-deazaguanine synthase